MIEILEGLRRPQKAISPKFFYDERGSRLFEEICLLPEYYLTRAESEILAARVGEISRILGDARALVEFGSGASEKTRLLLRGIGGRGTYVPIEISREILDREARSLAREFPALRVAPVCADFTKIETLDLAKRSVLLFSGSTIGNFDPGDALLLLKRIARLLGPGGHLIIGVDLAKARETIEAAYNDSRGVTAAFNRNLLARLNREYGADFELEGFAHRAFFNASLSRIEMHLVSLEEQAVSLGGSMFAFARGETIHTESSYKYDREVFAGLLKSAGFSTVECWKDARELFAVFHAA
jgi:L-histidine N-alpha-methyltransferase